jgi:hypothetical protein
MDTNFTKPLTIDSDAMDVAVTIYKKFSQGVQQMTFYECIKTALLMKQNQIIQDGFNRIIETHNRTILQ